MKKSLALAFSLGMLLGFSPSMYASESGSDEDEVEETVNLLGMVTASDVVALSLATWAVSLGSTKLAKNGRPLTREDLRKAAIRGAAVGGTLFGAVIIHKSMRATYYGGCYCVGKAQDGANYAGGKLKDGSKYVGGKVRDGFWGTVAIPGNVLSWAGQFGSKAEITRKLPGQDRTTLAKVTVDAEALALASHASDD